MRLNLLSVFSPRSSTSQLVCLALAGAVIILLFGDVIFLHTSLAPLDYDQGILASLKAEPPPKSILPERPGRSILDSQGDLWSGSAQFQPAQRFMAFCLRHGESPYWDPYSATGNLGPEALVDLKFAPVTLVTALFGGSSTALSFVLVGLCLIAAYSILRMFTLYLGSSLEAALAACAVFFLNGFALVNLNLAIGQPYFIAPILLHAMLRFADRQTPLNAMLAIAAHVALFSTTFTPTAILALIVVYCITLSAGYAQFGLRAQKLAVLHLAFPAVSLLLLGFMYLPIIDAFGTYLRTFQDYSARRTPGISLINLLSLFTPKHFWESYLAMKLPATAPQGPYNKFTFHLGIVGPLIAVHSLTRLKLRTAPVVIATAACFSASVGQIFGIFPFTLIDSLPFFSFVQNDYWFCMACLSLMVLVAYGYDGLSSTHSFTYSCALLIGAIVSSFFFLYGYLGVYGRLAGATNLWTERYIVIFWVILAATSTIFALIRWSRVTTWMKRLLLICLIVEGVFYMNGLHPNRSERDERLPDSIVWLKAEIDRHPGSRILNIGRFGVFPNWGSALQIPQLELLSFGISWYENFFHRYIGSDLFLSVGASPATATYLFSDASLSVVGVRYVVVDAGNQRAAMRLSGLGYQIVRQDVFRLIFENPHAMPRVFAVRNVYTLNGLPSDIGANAMRSAATTDQALLAQLRRLGVSLDEAVRPSASDVESADRIQLASYHHDRIQVRCNLKNPALLVLTDSWNPRWSATIDGKPAHIGKVDVAFRGIAVAAGQHEVEFAYYPLSRVAGQVISFITFIGLITGLRFWQKSLRARTLAPASAPFGAGDVTSSSHLPPTVLPDPPRRSRRRGKLKI
jgi:hypothetical protein